MDLKETTFNILIPDQYKKYGWTNNIKARVANEYLHDIKWTVYFMQKDPETYFYMLKRSINRGASKYFKKYFEFSTWTTEHKDAIKSLLFRAVYKKNMSVTKYLLTGYKNILDLSTEVKIQLLYSAKSHSMVNLIYNELLIDEPTIKRITFSTWCNLSDLGTFYDDEVLKYMSRVCSQNAFKESLFTVMDEIDTVTDIKEKPLSMKEAFELFGYKFQPRKN